MRQADVIVIGAGVLGTFHAYFAARAGYRTLLIERDTLPNAASLRNFGMIAPSIAALGSEWAGFARQSTEIYRAIQREHDISAHETGSLYLASTDAESQVLGEYAAQAAPEEHCHYLGAQEALARYAFIQPSYCAGALLFPHDLTLDPARMLRQLIPYVTQTAPVEYVPHTAIIAVAREGTGCRVTAASGEIFGAQHVIICSGAEYRTLFPHLLLQSGLQLCKLQMMQTAPLPGLRLPHSILSGLSIRRYPAFASCPSYGLLDEQPSDAALRAYGIHLLFKQATDGSVIIGDSHEYSSLADASAFAERTNPLINAAILRHAQGMLVLPSWEIAALWNGYYLTHPERHVYTETIDGAIHVVTGIGGKGMTTGPGFSRAHIGSLLA